VARIAGVNIPTNKRVVIALQYIHGIGAKKASEIMTKVGIPDARGVAADRPGGAADPRNDRPDYLVEGDLRREVSMNIKRLMDLGCYEGSASSRASCPRPAHPHQCPHPQRAGEADRGQEEVSSGEAIRFDAAGASAAAERQTSHSPSDCGDIACQGSRRAKVRENGPREDREWAKKPPAFAAANARTSLPGRARDASFNNTMITITDAQGNTIAWSSPAPWASRGRKSTLMRPR